MVGGDQQRAARRADRIGDPAEAVSDRLHRLDGGRQAAGVADHVGVGVVQQDQVVLAGADRLDRLAVNSGADISGLQIVGRDLGEGTMMRSSPA